MSRARPVGLLLTRSALLSIVTIVTIVVLVFPAPAGANPVPEAMVYFNVRPFGSPDSLCVTDIDDCAEMRPSTPDQGLLEFQIFIDPQQRWHGAIPVAGFFGDLYWPEEWTVVDSRLCFPGEWWLDVSGSGPHRVEIYWPCPVPDPLFLAFTIVFDVQGYGRLETANCELWLDCPEPFSAIPTAHFAEAGTGCEYTDQPCAQSSLRCLPDLVGLELPLRAPEGGTANGQLEFDIDGYPYPRCDFVANSEEPWAAGYVVSDPNLLHAVLFVDANAAGLEPGVYESEMQVAYDGTYGGGPVRNARCLPVILTVEPAAAVEDPLSPDAVRDPLGLQLVGANPSSGPFVFMYETPAASRVRCAVYDASGREVAQLLDGEQPGGRHTISWPVVDASGRRVRPGVYIIRLARDAEVRSSRLIVVR